MDREELDAWFARADDVLTDWHGSPDSMNSAGVGGSIAGLVGWVDELHIATAGAPWEALSGNWGDSSATDVYLDPAVWTVELMPLWTSADVSLED